MSVRVPALATLALLVALTAGAAEARTSSLRFTFAPHRVFQGQDARITVAARPGGVRCTLSVAYADGSAQPGLRAVRARSGKASWRWKVATNAAVGRARAVVSCGRAGRGTRFLNVVRATPVSAVVRVEKWGLSQRNRPGSARVSYGVVLVNPAADKDANDVTVQVNIVDAANKVLASPVTRVKTMAAGATYYLGGATTLPVGGTAARLETIVRVGAQVERRLHVPPVADVRFYASRYDPEWMGGIAGQVLNDLRGIALARASLSVVVFDAAGNVVGGATGTTSGAKLPPGGRAFWQAISGADSIPWSRVAAVQVSVNPTWEPLEQ